MAEADIKLMQEVASGAEAAVINYVTEALVAGEEPTDTEIHLFAWIMIMVASRLEARVKAYMPPQIRDNMRAFMEQFSAKVGEFLNKQVDIAPLEGYNPENN